MERWPGVGGVRSEHVILVTNGPAEVLLSFNRELNARSSGEAVAFW